jgi:valyl-tRNA synthetase
MGWDDNGLPTERRVQHHFHVRCDSRLRPDPEPFALIFNKRDYDSPPTNVSRSEFIELCLRLTREDEEAFKALFTRVGLSVDWRLEYSTIDNRCRKLAQMSFLDLFHKGHIYNLEAPMMWEVDFQTAIAQAEVEDRPGAGRFLFDSVWHPRGYALVSSDRANRLLPVRIRPRVTVHGGGDY